MEMLRRQFGIAEPVRRGMELKIAEAGEWRPAALGGSSGVHRDILQGGAGLPFRDREQDEDELVEVAIDGTNQDA
jgi:hypothetical protein